MKWYSALRGIRFLNLKDGQIPGSYRNVLRIGRLVLYWGNRTPLDLTSDPADELYEMYVSPAVMRGEFKMKPKPTQRPKSDAEVLRDIIAVGIPITATEKDDLDRRLKGIISILEPKFEPGICRFCHCTEDDPCFLQVDDEMTTCSWFDSAQTVCSNPRCIDRYIASKSKTRTPPHDEFLCGVALVLGDMLRHHSEKNLAQMIMRGHGITYDQLKAGGVDQYDLKEIRRIK